LVGDGRNHNEIQIGGRVTVLRALLKSPSSPSVAIYIMFYFTSTRQPRFLPSTSRGNLQDSADGHWQIKASITGSCPSTVQSRPEHGRLANFEPKIVHALKQRREK
jgi:hypothetical protein